MFLENFGVFIAFASVAVQVIATDWQDPLVYDSECITQDHLQ